MIRDEAGGLLQRTGDEADTFPASLSLLCKAVSSQFGGAAPVLPPGSACPLADNPSASR